MKPTLKLGSTGPYVAGLIHTLFKGQHLSADQFQRLLCVNPVTFTREVKVAVMDFQARHLDPRGLPLVVDGIVGPLTWWALEQFEDYTEPPELPHLDIPDTGGSTIGRDALAVALAEALDGAREVGANNFGPFVEKYLMRIIPAPANWCAAGFSWCFHEACGDAAMPFNYSLGARDIRNQFKRKGWTYEHGEKDPEPGDAVFWWRGRPEGWMGHIGLVRKLDNGILYTVEFNKGAFPAPVRGFEYVFSRMERVLGFGQVPD